jgi:phospholipid-binding lipoprotein MlaA
MHRWPARVAAALTVLAALSGCASVPPEAQDPRDPWQPYNRAVFKFNTDFDNAFLKPTAQAYQFITPEPLDKGVTNFFNNIADATSAANNLFQFKLSRAGSDVGRVFINTTVGFAGFFDVATNVGLPSYKEDFGQTLGYWGFGAGPYFVLPILGPSTVRDSFGVAGDVVLDPFFSISKNEVYWGFVTLRVVDRRADLLTAGELIDEAAIDRYALIRDAYLQRRRTLVHDGDPPPAEDEDPVIWEDIPPPAP